ncbi:MAG: outer membrane beta-barrel protein [Luteolibacter sp.]
MKAKFTLGLFGLALASQASAQGLYYSGTEAQQSIPLKWQVGVDATYDDNVSPGYGDDESAVSVNPYVGLSFVSVDPQTTWDVYARLGLVYYLDKPDNIDSSYTNARAGVDFAHRFSERLRFSSLNFISYELEPDYSYGISSSRAAGEYFYWQTDNSVGFRWSERFATYTGLQLTGLTYQDVDNNDRFTWTAYNQFRYQLTPQTVLTAEYRYAQTSGNGAYTDSTDQYILGGLEHRFSPTTIGIFRAGAQLHDVDGGDSYTSPYVEAALNSRVNEQFSVKAFTRYGIENFNTVQNVGGLLTEFSDRRTLRVGVSGNYAVSKRLGVFGGVDYIPTSYRSGKEVVSGNSVSDQDEDLINAYIGVSLQFTDYLFGSLTYNHTTSDSDLSGNDYDRNRVSVGVRAEF